jgi:hypothetical protein
MSKALSNTWISWAVLLLLIINLISLGLNWTGKKKHDVPKRTETAFKGGLEHDLDMTEEQIKEFGKLKKKHHKEVEPLVSSLKEKREALIKDGIWDTESEDFNNRLDEIGKIQKDLDKSFFSHFAEVRNVLDEPRRKKLDEFIPALMHGISAGGQRGREQNGGEHPGGGPAPHEINKNGGPDGEEGHRQGHKAPPR